MKDPWICFLPRNLASNFPVEWEQKFRDSDYHVPEILLPRPHGKKPRGELPSEHNLPGSREAC